MKKLGKKALIALSFAVGACLFLTTALADMTLGTGYDRLKEAVKRTSAQLEEGLDSYTLVSEYQMTIDGKVINHHVETMKVNATQRASETSSLTSGPDGKSYSWYEYRDEHIQASKRLTEDNKFYVTEYTNGNRFWKSYTDPFQEDVASDMERIADALVGNLKDYVVVEPSADGGKVYSGHLSQMQVPTLVNAVLSFLLKQTIFDYNSSYKDIPRITEDVYVSQVSGRAEEDASGLLRSLTGKIIVSGADDDGVPHELVVDLNLQLTDIGSTTVTRPDLTGAVVEKYSSDHFPFSSKYIGVYRNDIVLEETHRFVKIGERTLEITAVGNDSVTGRLYETVDPEYLDEFGREPLSIEFVTRQQDWSTVFEYKDENGVTYQAQIYPSRPGMIYIYPNVIPDENGNVIYELLTTFDGEFRRVFE